MSEPTSKPPLDQLRDAALRAEAAVEQDLRKLITFVNDEVVPDVRRSGSAALRRAANELQRLAQQMEDSTKSKP